MTFLPMQQVAYVPRHANGDINHPDVEHGFVTSVRQTGMGLTVFCRYWSKHDPNELRTKANSEGADASMVVPHVSHTQAQVEGAWMEYVACQQCGAQNWHSAWKGEQQWLACHTCIHSVACITL